MSESGAADDGLGHAGSEERSRALTEIAERGVEGLGAQERTLLVSKLERFLAHDDSSVVASAAFALSKVGTSASVPALASALDRSKNLDADTSRQVLIALYDVTDGQNAAVLEPALSSNLTDIRVLGADLIAHTSDPRATGLLARRHQSETDPKVRNVIEGHLNMLARGERGPISGS